MKQSSQLHNRCSETLLPYYITKKKGGAFLIVTENKNAFSREVYSTKAVACSLLTALDAGGLTHPLAVTEKELKILC